MTTPFDTHPLLFIGGGNMAQAMIRGLLAHNTPPQHLGVLGKSLARLHPLGAQWGIKLHEDSADTQHYAVWVLAVKPQDLPGLCQQLSPHYADYTARHQRPPLIVSVAAGVSTQSLAQWLCGSSHNLTEAPPIVRVMPNTPSAISEGMSGAYATPSCTKDERMMVAQVLDAMGQSVWVDNEDSLHAITAVSASGTAYFLYFAECLEHTARGYGLSEEMSRLLARQTLIGAGALAKNSSETLSTLRQRVTSKGGTTEQALLTFQAHLPQIVEAASRAAFARSQAMAKR